MAGEASEQMLELLKELAGLKEIDSQRRPRTRQEKAASRDRQRRRDEIRQAIKELAADDKAKS